MKQAETDDPRGPYSLPIMKTSSRSSCLSTGAASISFSAFDSSCEKDTNLRKKLAVIAEKKIHKGAGKNKIFLV